MLKKGTIPLGCPDRGSLTRVFLVALLALFSFAPAHARTNEQHATDPQAYNKDVRTGTWSIYAQGGLSWVTGLWYQNVNAKKSYGLAPAVGGGIVYEYDDKVWGSDRAFLAEIWIMERPKLFYWNRLCYHSY